MNFKLSAAALLAFCIVMAPQASFGQETKPADPPKRDQKALDYEKEVKDLPKYEGSMSAYVRKKDLLIEINESDLDKIFFIQSTMSTGFSQDLQAGDPVATDPALFQNVMAFAFERHDDDVWLIRPNIKYRWSPDDPLALASARSMPRAILSSYKIERSNPETHKLLINFTNFFGGEITNLPLMVSALAGGQYSVDRAKSGVSKIYANNSQLVVQMDQFFFSPRGAGENPLAALMGLSGPQAEDSRSLPLKVNYTLWFRPKSDYMPRLSDPRVGYFTQDFYSMDKFYSRVLDRQERYINRWDMRKKDPTAAMSDPVKPIIWTLDNSIPERFRGAVREGLLRWNKAFEQIGIKNAVQVVDAPEDQSKYDHADGTRNVIRFTMTEDKAYAVALFRTDPFSGEILNAAITVDANFTAFLNQEYMFSAIPTTNAFTQQLTLAQPALTTFTPETASPREIFTGTYSRRAPQLAQLQKLGWNSHFCDIQQLMRDNMAMEYRMAKAVGINMTADDWINKAIADTVAHEAGHCMGLRHNFVASDTLSPVELADPNCVKQYGVAASVMDYTPTNVAALLSGQKDILFNSSVGPYDMFAIKYGYSSRFGGTPDGERFGLGQIARLSGQKGNAYMTDEDADAFNPYVVRFDSSNDPLGYGTLEISANKKLRGWAMNNLPRQGEGYGERNLLILASLRRQLSTSMSMTAFVGGLVGNRNFKGDVGEKPTLAPVDADMQRRAIRLIAENALSITSLGVSESEMANLGLDYNTVGSTNIAPIRTMISQTQMMILAELLSGSKGNMILENEFKSRGTKNPFTLDEHYATVINAVFSEVGNNQNIASTRRDLQSYCIWALLQQAKATPTSLPSDINRVANDCLRSLQGRIRSQIGSAGKLESATVSHLRNLNDQINRFNERVTIN